jgi:CPA1 family monovalent cation:H+ antiporter
MFDAVIVCLVLTALLAYLNKRFIGLPTTIGVMVIALMISGVLLGLDKLGHGELREYEEDLLHAIDFSQLLMQGMLSMLLFAAALQVDLSELKAFKWQIGAFAIFGTVASTLLIGYGLWALLPLAGVNLPLAYCLIFGALISPTDPIAVMGILTSAGAPKSLEIVISGESLFNDGVGVVLFSMMVAMAVSGEEPTVARGAMLLLVEGGGGILLGLALGFGTFHLLKAIDSYQEEVLLTLAAVLGGYALATHLHVSGPLAMVVAGLVIGNHARAEAMSDRTRKNMDMFWELLDSILNAVLFVLIGLEAILIKFSSGLVLVSAMVIAITLTARLISVGAPIVLFGMGNRLPAGAFKVLTWGALRGGISVALVLSLARSPQRDILLALTYATVLFSILVQGLTIGKLARSVRD